jgi:hypothetical protein
MCGRRDVVRLFAAVLAAVFLALTAPATADAALKAIWGPTTLPNGESAFPVYEDLGVEVLQIPVRWSAIAPSRPAEPRNPDDPAYRWAPDLDTAVAEARRYGIRIALMVLTAPPWANGGHDHRYAPLDPRDYADFLVAVSQRYPSVRHWMIWGEPSRIGNWRPLPSNSPVAPRRYAKLLDRAYGTLKRRNERNIIIGGMTFTAGDVLPADWLRWMRLPSGRPPRLDWYGHNAFSTRYPDMAKRPYVPGLRDFSDLDTLHRQLRRTYGKRRTPPIWVAEYTVSSDRVNRDFSFYVSRRSQARWLRTAYRIARRKPYIAGLGWIGLVDGPDPDGYTGGLLDERGRPKPAYYAYRAARL